MAEVTPEDVPLRPTGPMERFNIMRNNLNFYNNIQVSATYTLPPSFIRTHALLPIIHSTLAEVLKTNPILGVCIEGEDTPEPKWKRLQSIKWPDILTIIGHDHAQSHDSWITSGHRRRLDRTDELPLWRVNLAIPPAEMQEHTFTLGFFCHHAIADGMSAGAFHLSFLSALNHFIDIPSLIRSQLVVAVPKNPLIDTLEMRSKLPMSIWFITKTSFRQLYNPPDPLLWTGPLIQSTPPDKPPTSNLLTFSLPNPTVKILVQACRQQKTTLTSLLSVLVARHLAVTHPSHKHFIGQIPFSMRKWSRHSPTDMGLYISGLSTHFSSEVRPPSGYIPCLSSTKKDVAENEDKRMLWASARQVRTFIDNNVGERNALVGLLKIVSDMRKVLLEMLGKNRATSFEVTNIGAFDGGLDSGWSGEATFDNMYFSSALCTYGDPWCISVVSVKGGNMTVGVNWVEGRTSDDEARELAGWLEGSLKSIVDGYDPGEKIYVEDVVKANAGLTLGIWGIAGVLAVGIAGWYWRR